MSAERYLRYLREFVEDPLLKKLRSAPIDDEPETEEEKKLYDGALRRRQVRLILGGKMKPDDATELKALFFPQV